MSITEEQLMQLIARAVATAIGASQAAAAAAIPVTTAGGSSGGGNNGGRLLKEKGFSEVPKLARGQEQWTEWPYVFLRL